MSDNIKEVCLEQLGKGGLMVPVDMRGSMLPKDWAATFIRDLKTAGIIVTNDIPQIGVAGSLHIMIDGDIVSAMNCVEDTRDRYIQAIEKQQATV